MLVMFGGADEEGTIPVTHTVCDAVPELQSHQYADMTNVNLATSHTMFPWHQRQPGAMCLRKQWVSDNLLRKSRNI
jgi:hypothetical protein